MRTRLANFMIGRNGSDNLSRFVSVVVGIMILVAAIVGGSVSSMLWIFIVAGLAYCYFRIFSRDYNKRREENMRYLQFKSEFLSYFHGAKERFSQRRDYKFFRCPSCRAMLRVPRGKEIGRASCRERV